VGFSKLGSAFLIFIQIKFELQTLDKINNFSYFKLCVEAKHMDKDNKTLVLEYECNTFLQNTVNIYQTTRCHIPQDGKLHGNYCGNFNSPTWTK